MVLAIVSSIYSSALLSPFRTHLPHIFFGSLAIYVFYLLSQGRKTSRDRDLHARTILLTGAFDSALGITLLVELAKRGANVVCLTDKEVGRASSSGRGEVKKPQTAEAATAEEEKNPYEEEEEDGIDSKASLLNPTEGEISLEDHGDPNVHTLVSLVRATTRNANIWAETCNIEDPASVKQFCVRWLTGAGDQNSKESKEEKEARAKEPSLEGQGGAPADQRLDAIVFTHEYPSLGSLLPSFSSQGPSTTNQPTLESLRDTRSLGTFLLTTLLLPSLLIAPTERDIRIVNVVGPFYAAAVRGAGGEYAFTSILEAKASSSSKGRSKSGSKASETPKADTSPSLTSRPTFLAEGIRSLRTIIFTRHLQRILDALPAPPVVHPSAASGTNDIPVPSRALQRSNIVAVSVSPGVGRSDTVGRLLGWGKGKGATAGVVLYILLHPLLRIFTKSPSSAVQSVLHALFLPTAFKSAGLEETSGDDASKPTGGDTKSNGAGQKARPSGGNKLRFREVLKPGALYGECAVVTLDIPSTTPLPSPEASTSAKDSAASSPPASGKAKDAKKPGAKSGTAPEEITIPDDGEYGGEEAGRRVWETYEGAVKKWEAGV